MVEALRAGPPADPDRPVLVPGDPEEAERVTDFVSTTMSGLSAKARNGHGLDQLLTTARLAATAVAQVLPA